MHVRGFTASPTSGVEHPGTYLGVIEKIPYLKSLGVTAVELMPVHEFAPHIPSLEFPGERRNYWGYDPVAFFAPHRGYAAGTEPGCQVREFKEMVRALHAAGIEVILDVVFNHTAEGNHLGPTFSFKGLENRVYYMLGDGGSTYRNYTGCGNTINGNHPIVRELIFLCLRHWVHNYHIDGFRFDLASVLSRDRNGEILPNPPIVELITEDPLLADTKIIAEAWDAAGAYQVGSFASLRWAEWNGRYRDDVRRYWRGDFAQTGHLATRLAGSSDLYGDDGRQPYHSINFVTSHDGFTLNDLVSYREKHNEANGEGNRDGDDNSFAENYGIEGPTQRADINALRARQIRNMAATLLLSQGVPMLVAGDECRRTQRGNNNAWCQDNDVSWFDWSLLDAHPEFVRFFRELISFRLGNPTLRRRSFLQGGVSASGTLPDVEWFSPDGVHIDWYAADGSLSCFFGAPSRERLEAEDDAAAGDPGPRGPPATDLHAAAAERDPGPALEAVRSHGPAVASRHFPGRPGARRRLHTAARTSRKVARLPRRRRGGTFSQKSCIRVAVTARLLLVATPRQESSMLARFSVFAALLACLSLSGCSSSSPPVKPAADKAAAAGHDHDHDHDHGHDHEEHEHDHPDSFAAGVAQLQATVAAVKDHLAVGATDAADEVVHGLGHLIEDVQGLMSKEKLSDEAKATASKALDELFECFDKLDTAIHAPEGTSQPPAEVHASLAERIDAAIKSLQSTLTP
jgi:glycosidase/predicted small lipoprotein YifL